MGYRADRHRTRAPINTQTLERFAASGLSWPEAREMDEEALEAALYRRPRASDWPEVDWAKVEKDLSGRGVTLMLLWQE